MQTASNQSPRVSASKQWWWPNVETREGAEWAMKQAFWAAVVVAVLTAIVAVMAAFRVSDLGLGINRWAIIDAAIFGAIALGLRKQSKVAAWAGVLLFAYEKIYMWATVGFKGPILAIIIFLAFLGGVRGSLALGRMERETAEGGEQPTIG